MGPVVGENYLGKVRKDLTFWLSDGISKKKN
jgi:hypothetical protein